MLGYVEEQHLQILCFVNNAVTSFCFIQYKESMLYNFLPVHKCTRICTWTIFFWTSCTKQESQRLRTNRLQFFPSILYTICIFPLFNLSFVFFVDREELNKETWGIVLSNSVSQETKIIHIFVIFIKTNFHPWFHYSRRVYMFLIYGFVIKAFIFYVKNFENVYTFEPSAALWWFLHTYMLTFICLTLQIISSELSRKDSWTVVAHCSR